MWNWVHAIFWWLIFKFRLWSWATIHIDRLEIGSWMYVHVTNHWIWNFQCILVYAGRYVSRMLAKERRHFAWCMTILRNGLISIGEMEKSTSGGHSWRKEAAKGRARKGKKEEKCYPVECIYSYSHQWSTERECTRHRYRIHLGQMMRGRRASERWTL